MFLPDGCSYYCVGALALLGLGIVWFSRRFVSASLLDQQMKLKEFALEHAREAVYLMDENMRFIYVNQEACRALGLGREELLGLTPSDIDPDHTPEAALAAREKIWAQGAIALETRHRRRDGSLFPVEIQGSLFKYRERLITMALARDISERRQMEAALRRSEREFRSLAENSPDIIIRYDRDCRRLYLNPTFCRTFGKPAEQLLGNSPADGALLAAEENLRLIESIRQVLDSGENRCLDLHALTRDKQYRDYHMLLVPERGEDGQVASVLSIARDITAIRNSERRTAHFLSSLPGFVYSFRSSADGHCSFPFVSRGVEDIYGLRPADVRDDALPLHNLAHPGDRPRIEAAIAESARTLAPFQAEFRVRRPGFPERWIEARSLPERESDGGTLWHGVMLDITERVHLQQALAAREQEFRTLVENSPDTIARYDRECRRTFANPAFCALIDGGVTALLGKTPGEVPGGENAERYERKIREVLASGENTEFELKWLERTGREMCSLIRLAAERDSTGEVVSVLSVGRDISELRDQYQQIHRMKFYDPLTELLNRVSFADLLRCNTAEAARRGQSIGIMLLDLDHFKAVNDSLGHPAGDTLLRETALRLEECVRSYDTVARLGGDEFAIMLPAIRAREELVAIAERVQKSFSRPFLLDGREIFASASIGITLYPEHGDVGDTDELLKQASAAMYAAKRGGRNIFRFYTKALTSCANERLSLESELRRSLERGELELYYQPKIKLADDALIGAEALLRWNHPQRGLMLPDRFVSIAEECGLITDIGEWALRSACQTAYEWNGPGKPLLKVAVNLSARQFLSRNLAVTVSDVLEETGCPPGWIELEITESLLLEDNDGVRKTLAAFREMGITVAIDDFGTGYSALSYLARFPIDILKIDRSFISRLAENGHHAELVKAILSLARSLKQNVVAEGVETMDQAAFLRSQNCYSAQGYLYGWPIPKAKFITFQSP